MHSGSPAPGPGLLWRTAGLAIIDISDPPAARIVHQVRLEGRAQAVAAGGGVVYVGLSSGKVMSVDLATGTIISQVLVPGNVQDVRLGGDHLYPPATTSSPGIIFLDETTQPTIRVTKIGDADVPANPTGSFAVPDVVVAEPTEITIEVTANNIPTDATVKVRVISEDGTIQDLEAGALTGTLAESTASANVTLPPGLSRMFPSATWEP
jgi:outer membrane protein assembly factor BamB